MAEICYKFVTISNEIEGAPNKEDFQMVTTNISTKIEPGSNQVLVKCLFVAIDPYQLNRMKKFSASQGIVIAATKLVPGKPINANGIGRVVDSGHPEFQEGDLVTGRLNWAEYVMLEHGTSLTKLDPMGFPLSYHLGILGVSGFTAYAGLFKVCKTKKGEKVFVSTAVGSVGNLVGQYAKLLGCYVVGCAGTTQKVDLLKEKLGFDDAFNYKEERDLKSTLRRYFPDGINIYFDNVGGEMLEAAVANMSLFGRVAACGAISQYADSTGRSAAAPDMIDIIYKRITICRYLVLEDISHGLESIPSAFVNFFCGHNIGKTVVQIADD